MDEDLKGTLVYIIATESKLTDDLAERLGSRGVSVRVFRTLGQTSDAPPPHVVVLALGEFGERSLTALRSRFYTARFLVVSSCNEPEMLRSFAEGVHGWIMAWEPVQTIESAVLLMARGASAMSLAAVSLLFRDMANVAKRGPPVASQHGLSTRQFEVLQLAAQGMGDRQIAETLTLSVRTVHRHVSDVLEKLRCHGREDAVQLVFGESPPPARIRRIG